MPQPSPALVLDSSVALAWCFADESSAYADMIAKKLPHLHLVVPALWHLEIGNILLLGERRKRSLQADTSRLAEFLRSLYIVVDEDTEMRAWSDTLSLARTLRLSVYDAAYLELAMRLGLPLATLDKKLRSAAKEAGIALYAA